MLDVVGSVPLVEPVAAVNGVESVEPDAPLAPVAPVVVVEPVEVVDVLKLAKLVESSVVGADSGVAVAGSVAEAGASTATTSGAVADVPGEPGFCGCSSVQFSITNAAGFHVQSSRSTP